MSAVAADSSSTKPTTCRTRMMLSHNQQEETSDTFTANKSTNTPKLSVSEEVKKNMTNYTAKKATRAGFGAKSRTGPSFNISIAKRNLAPASQVISSTPILSPQASSTALSFDPVELHQDEPSAPATSKQEVGGEVLPTATTTATTTATKGKRRHHLPSCSRRRPRGQSSQKAQEEEANSGRRSGLNTPLSTRATVGGSGTYDNSASPFTVTATQEFSNCFNSSYHDPLHSSGLTASNVDATFIGSNCNEVSLEHIKSTPKQAAYACAIDHHVVALTPNSNASVSSWTSHCTECEAALEENAAAFGTAVCASPQLTSSLADYSAAFTTTATKKVVVTPPLSKRTHSDEHMALSEPSQLARKEAEGNSEWFRQYILHQPNTTNPSPSKMPALLDGRLFRSNSAPTVSVAFNSRSCYSTIDTSSMSREETSEEMEGGGMMTREHSNQTVGGVATATTNEQRNNNNNNSSNANIAWGRPKTGGAMEFGGCGGHHTHSPTPSCGTPQQQHQPTVEESALYRISNECEASRLLPQLYLGGYSDTQDVGLLERFHITRILSVAKECTPMAAARLVSNSTLKKGELLAKVPLFSATRSVLEICGEDRRDQSSFAESNVVNCDNCVFGALWIGPANLEASVKAVVDNWRSGGVERKGEEEEEGQTGSSFINSKLVTLHPDLASRVFAVAEGNGTVFSTLHVPMVDHSDEDIGRWFEMCADYIQDGACRGEATLVHCRVGVSRSAATCMAYLMKYGIRVKEIKDAFNFNLDAGGGRDWGYRGGKSLLTSRSSFGVGLRRTQTQAPSSLLPSADSSTADCATMLESNTSPTEIIMIPRYAEPNPLNVITAKVHASHRVWEIATSALTGIHFECDTCKSRGLINMSYVAQQPFGIVNHGSISAGSGGGLSSLGFSSVGGVSTGFTPSHSWKKTLSNSRRADMLTKTTTDATTTSLPANGAAAEVDDNHSPNGTELLAIPSTQLRELCVHRGQFSLGRASFHRPSDNGIGSAQSCLASPAPSATASTWSSAMSNPSSLTVYLSWEGQTFPKSPASSPSVVDISKGVSRVPSMTPSDIPEFTHHNFHCHPISQSVLWEVAQQELSKIQLQADNETPPTTPADANIRTVSAALERRKNAAEDRLPHYTDYEEVLAFVKRAREEIGPNFGFSYALRELSIHYGFSDALA